jgi:serine/threonine protein phosphatase PrpC
MLTWQSNQHPQNQDRAFVYPRFVHNQLQEDEDSFLVGVLDGHGRDGHIMADFVVQHLATVLVQNLNVKPCCQSDDWIKSKLIQTFIEMEQLAVHKTPSQDFAYTGGCTASVTLRIGNRLFVANVGDSRTMLASDFDVTSHPDDPYTATIQFTSRLDKADVPEERARIEGLGGTIHFPPPEKRLTSRVILHSTHLLDTVGLAMSRSLGDHEWTAVGVIPDPVVDIVRLDEDILKPYLIVASDGLWDCRARRPQFFAKRLGAMLFNTKENSYTDATTEFVNFLKEITPQQPQVYRDDITVVAFRL